MIKPDAFCAGKTGAIIKMIEESGFIIKAAKLYRFSKEDAGKFYEIHKERPFFNDLINYISSGSIVAMVLEKDHAVEDFRKLIGAPPTPPRQKKEPLENYLHNPLKQMPYTDLILMKTQK